MDVKTRQGITFPLGDHSCTNTTCLGAQMPRASPPDALVSTTPESGHGPRHDPSLPSTFLVRQAGGGPVAQSKAAMHDAQQRSYAWSCTHVQVFPIPSAMPFKPLVALPVRAPPRRWDVLAPP